MRLASEILVSMGPSPHLLFLLAKQQLLDQNYKSLGSQTLPMVFCIQNIVISIRITSLHGSQTSPVVLCIQNNVISIRITSLYGSQTSPMVCCLQNRDLSIRITILYGSQPSFVAFVCKTASLGQELQVSMFPRPHLSFCACKIR